MKLTHLATAAAAVALLGGAAYAQATDTTSMPQAPTTGSMAADQPSQDTTAPAGATSSTSAAPSSTGAAVNPPAPATTDTTVAADASTTTTSAGTFTNMTVTNGPVPDTAENRQKYGAPMSRAGKRTAARGN